MPRERIPQAFAYRSTMMRSTIAILEQRGLREPYVAALPAEHRQAILEAVPGAWLSAQLGLVHYEACDRLGLSDAEQASIGWETSRRIHGPVITTALRAMGAVTSPWMAASLLHRNWARVWMGSAMAVDKLAHNEAIIELAGWPAARIPYARVALRGALRGTIEYFCRRARLSERLDMRTDDALGFHVVWY